MQKKHKSMSVNTLHVTGRYKFKVKKWSYLNVSTIVLLKSTTGVECRQSLPLPFKLPVSETQMIQTEIKGTESKKFNFHKLPWICYYLSWLFADLWQPSPLNSNTKSLFFVAQMTTWSILQIHDSTKTYLTLSTRSQNQEYSTRKFPKLLRFQPNRFFNSDWVLFGW